MTEEGRPDRPSILLIVSLCLNVALIGLAAAMFFRAGMRPFEAHEARGGLSAAALMRMAPAEQDKIAAVLDAHRPKLHELRRQAMQARTELFQLLSAPAFDSQAFAKASEAVQAADSALEAESLRTTVESMALLTPQERVQVASEVHKPGRTWLKHLLHKR
ncbi:MAG: periplasmic heavy metal sensor [Alphaproteobacteria bacterium]|nr:periplasmic heavy metal sensor [Alphaproteobacteria bacterium]MBV9694707.1 periplasmic heavy metal sensor [Alphaproteobacteria bacterium]